MAALGTVAGRLAVVLIALVLFFRAQIDNRFSILFGDPNDAVITTSLIEHWHRVFSGLDRWNQIPYFAPHTDTLGYGEGFFLIGVAAAPFRAAGVDPFVAADLGTMVMRGIGGFCFAVLAQRVFRLSLPASLLGSVLVTGAGNALVQADHAQLASSMLLPPLALLLAQVCRSAGQGRLWLASAWACAAAGLLDAWLLTAFYTAWFAILLLLIAGLIWLSQLIAGRARGPVPGGLDRDIVLPTFLPVLVGAVGAIPFLLAYLPRMAETGLHAFAVVRPNIPHPLELLNSHLAFGLVGDLPWGIGAAIRAANIDPAGFAPLLLLTAIAGLALSLAGSRTWHDEQPRPLWRSTGLATLVCLLLVTSVPAWHAIYAIVPGAKVVRAPARFLLILQMPLVLLAMLVLDRLARRGRRALLPLLALAAVLLIEEQQTRPPVAMARLPGDRLVAAVATPPAACRSFFVSGRNPEGWHTSDDAPNYRHNADAMFVAVMTGLPTINGYSTFNPPDWDFADVDAPDYPGRVGKYADAHALLPGLCELDLGARRWNAQVALPAPVLALGQTMSLANTSPQGSRYTLSGWGGGEGDGRWTVSATATLRVRLPREAADTPLRLSMKLSALLAGNGTEPVIVLANGHRLGSIDVPATPQPITLDLPAGIADPDGALVVTLRQPPLRTPREVGIAPDDRHLGLYLWWFRLDPR